MAKQTFTTGQVLTAAQVNSLQSNDFNQTVSAKTAAYTLVAADKGTRIEFNTSGSVTCTVNTGLFDAGDTLVIQNRGAGVVTVTAGTATVNTSATLALSQYDAGTLYFISASAAIFFNTDAGGGSPLTTKGDLYGFSTVDARIPIGANDTVLTADSNESLGLKWAAAGSVDVWTLLNTTTLPLGNSTVTVTGLSSEKILVTITNASHAGGGSGFYFVTPTCGTTTNSEWRGIKRTAAGTMLENTQGVNAPIANSTTAGTDTVSGYVLYTGCKSTSGEKSVQSAGGSSSDSASTGAYVGGGIVMASAALTEITFANTANNFAGGTMKIYGA